jgi:hypothetical protein
MRSSTSLAVAATYWWPPLLTPAELVGTRSQLRSLCLPGQRRVHFQSERDGRRREIIARLVGIGARARVYVGEGSAALVRSACLRRLVEDLVKFDARRLVVESRGHEADRTDRHMIAATLHNNGIEPDRLVYEHLKPHEEPGLWIPDAVAWCHGAGGEWRRRVTPLVDEVVDVTDELERRG